MSATSPYYRPPNETRPTPSYEELFGTPSPTEIYKRKRIAEEIERKEREEAARIGRLAAEGRKMTGAPEGGYRKSFNAENFLYTEKLSETPYERQQRLGLSDKEFSDEILKALKDQRDGNVLDNISYYDINDSGMLTSADALLALKGEIPETYSGVVEKEATFQDAKQAADETYMQYWYDKANSILNSWTNEDYALLAEPQYETYKTGDKWGSTAERRVLPRGYERLQEIQEYIEEGPLDFSAKETHYRLIKPPVAKGGTIYGKYQEWIDESDPLRQAVEAQADVMKDYLDKEGISIVQEFEDGNPANIYGEGVYLNTGTAAHIDWDSDLKRMQRYMTVPDSELGTYSQVFYRPEKQGIFDHWMADIIGLITGTTPYLTAARGGDVEDILTSVVLKEVIPDTFLEDTFASVGITNETVNDLIGSDIGSTAWSEGLTNVGVTVLEGGDLGDALLGEFGGELAEPIVGGALDALPDVDIPEGVTNVLETIETVAQPLIDAVDTVTETVGNVVDTTIIEPIENLTEAIFPEDDLDTAVTPEIVEAVEAPVKPEEAPVEPEETPVEPEETVAETKEETPVEPEETTLVGQVADKLGFDSETLSDILDVPEEEINQVFQDTDDALLSGESGKDALLEGFGESALGELGEGAENLLSGAVDFVETILPLDPLEGVVGAGVDLVDAAIGAVGDSELVSAIEEGGKALGDLGQSAIDAVVDSDIVQAVGDIGQQAIDIGSDILSEAEDVVSDVASEAEDVVKAVTDPIGEAGQDVIDTISDITSEGEDIVRELGRNVDDALIQPVVELVENIDLPEVDIDLPEVDIDLPKVDVDLPSFDPRLIAGLMPMPQQQKTQVEGLFDKELFKFDTEIKSTQEMLSPFMNLRRYG